MQAYKVTSRAVTIHSGRIQLTPDQADARENSLTAVKGDEGTFDVLQPVQFKAGEIIRIDEEIGKALAAQLAEPSSEELDALKRDEESQRQQRLDTKEQGERARQVQRDDQLIKRGLVAKQQTGPAASRLSGSATPSNPSPPGHPTGSGDKKSQADFEKR